MQRHFPITGFQADDLKKWERETPPAFPRTGHEKGGEAGASGDDSVQCDTTFNRFTTFFLPGLGKCLRGIFSTIFKIADMKSGQMSSVFLSSEFTL